LTKTGWIVSRFPGSENMRIGYNSFGQLFVNYCDEFSTHPFITHVVDCDKGISRKISYNCPLSRRCYCNKLPAQFSSDLLAMGDTVLSVSDINELSVYKTIDIHNVPGMVLTTAFHIQSSLMACLHQQIDGTLLLELYWVRQNFLLATTGCETEVLENFVYLQA